MLIENPKINVIETSTGVLTLQGALHPSADSTYDIGTNALRFKDTYFDRMALGTGTLAADSTIANVGGLLVPGALQSIFNASAVITTAGSQGCAIGGRNIVAGTSYNVGDYISGLEFSNWSGFGNYGHANLDIYGARIYGMVTRVNALITDVAAILTQITNIRADLDNIKKPVNSMIDYFQSRGDIG